MSEIGLRVHPLVLSITGVVEPSTGLQSKFSDAAFRRGGADRRRGGHRAIFRRQGDRSGGGGAAPQGASRSPTRRCARTRPMPPSSSGDKRHEVHIAHASGTADNPMSDAAIEAKFLANATPVIGAEHARRAATRPIAGRTAGHARADRAAGLDARSDRSRDARHSQYPRARSTAFSSGSPRSNRSICAMTCGANTRGEMSPALCGVIVTLGWLQSGLSGGSGSCGKTSSVAPASVPSSSGGDDVGVDLQWPRARR